MAQLLFSGISLPAQARSSLELALQLLEARLAAWVDTIDAYNALLLQVFGVQRSEASADLQRALSGTGLAIALEILPAATLSGINAAYTSSNPDGAERIYLNADWLQTATAAEIEALLLEELGHAIESRLNSDADTAGDEGEIFSALLRGLAPATSALTENDHKRISLNGVAVAIEAAADTTPPTGSLGRYATTPVYSAPVTNPFGIADVGWSASPAFADYDGDGDLDLFIGNYDGNTLLFTNTAPLGTTTPTYSAPDINPFGVTDIGSYANPALADYDRDGDLDLFIGNNSGNTLLFTNTAPLGATTPTYSAPVTNPFGINDVGSLASPAFADYDGDGDLDLFIGELYGNTLLFTNTAPLGAITPAYSTPVTNPFGITDVGYYARPAFADYDGDGDLDLFIGSYGNTLLFTNTAPLGATTPAYSAPDTNPFGITDIGWGASPTLADYDGDGDLDLFIGEGYGNTLLFTNIATTPVAAVGSTTPDGTYGVGAVITLTVGFSEPVFVNTSGGIPTLQLETGAIDRFAIYTSGSGTNTLSFLYTVQAGDTSNDLDQHSANALQLNGGTIEDAAGNNAIHTLSAPGASGSLAANAQLVIDGIAPTGRLGRYATTPAYSVPVTDPFGITNVGNNAKPALADYDGDGDLDLFIGNNNDYSGNILLFTNTGRLDAATPAYSEPVTNPFGIHGVGFDPSPALADYDRDGDLDLFIGNYNGNTLLFTNTAPFGATTPAYSAPVTNPFGDINFGYGINLVLVDYDRDGDLDVFISNRLGNTALITNTAPPGATTPTYRGTAVNPFGITDVGYSGSPAFADYDRDGDLDLFIGNSDGNTLLFTNAAPLGATTPSYSAPVTNPFGITDVGSYASPAFADYDSDSDLDLFIGDGYGNTLLSTNTAATPVAPVSTTSQDGYYGIGNVISLTVGFSEAVFVNTSGGTPTLQLETGAIDRLATYISGSGTNTLVFHYTVQAGDTSPDLDQLSANALQRNGGTIQDAAGNNAILTLAAPGETGSLAASAQLVIDGIAPTGGLGSSTYAAPVTNPFGITGVGWRAKPAFADYDGDGDLDLFIGNNYGNTLLFTNTAPLGATTPIYSAPATNPFGITNVGSNASPAFADYDDDGDLDLFIGNYSGNTLLFTNSSPLGATTPTYSAPVTNPFGIADIGALARPALADYDRDGDLDLFIGNSEGNALLFTNTAPLGSTKPSYSAPVYNPFGITNVGFSATPTFADYDWDGDLDLFIGHYSGNTLLFTNIAPVGATTPSYGDPVTNPFGITNIGYSTSPALTDYDRDGDLDLFIGELLGNTLLFTNTAATPGAPVSSITPDGAYGTGAVITLTIRFSEPVFVDTSGGSPTLQVETGVIDRLATYISGSGTNTLSFLYTVQAGDTSNDLDQLSANALQRNGSTIQDAAGNNAILTLAAPGASGSLAANAQLVIDGTAPTGSLGSYAIISAYSAPTTNPFGLTNVSFYANLALADYDRDGDLDLFIGNSEGNTLLFTNTAPLDATTPAYSTPVTNPFGITDVGDIARPAFADYDSDGDLDLFIGNRDGNTLLFTNTAPLDATTPTYSAPVTNPFGIIDSGSYASPNFADYDGDGDLDLFIGNSDGNTLLFINTAPLGATITSYSAPVTNPFGINDVGYSARPTFADYDRDGDLDLFIGEFYGNTLLFTNTAALGATTPAYSNPVTNPFGITDVRYIASPAFADYDADGDLDLFIGNYSGNTLLVTNTAATPVAPANSTTPDGTYGVGDVITLTVGFSEPVFVNASGGTPTLQLETGAIDRLATYISGSGTNTLSFQYTVQAGDTSTDLDQLSANALQRNGGTIQDAAGNNAILTLAAPGASGSLATNAQLVIDSTAPTGSLGGYATTPAYSAPVTNPLGITDVGKSSIPAFADYDDDGDLDLFIGNSDGTTLLFTNTAPLGATSPAYRVPVTNPFGITDVGAYASPAFADYDGDGDLDLFIGERYGNTLLFTNTAPLGATTPAYNAPITNPFGISDVGYSASPTFADYDRDGDLDLFIGNNSGNTLLFANTAPLDATTPTYSAPVANPFGISDVGFSASPTFSDYDGDGDLDLFIGNSEGNTLLFTNTAPLGATTPSYSAPVTNPFGITDVGGYASPALADYDSDSDLDLFIGNRDGNMLLFTNTAATPVAPVSSTTPDGTYGVGAVITVTVGFSEPVVVNTSGGTPTLQLETGAIDRHATYTSGSGTNTLSFHYTVQAGDTANDLDQLSANALQRNGATIQDAAGNNAILTLAAPGASGSLATNAQLVIDSTAPTGSLGGYATTPAYSAPATNPFRITNVGYIANPALADYDGDGDLDLFIGEVYGNTLLFTNTAPLGATTPFYSDPVANPFGIANVGFDSSPTFADYDRDGDLDLFIGNNSGDTLLFTNTAPLGATTPTYSDPVANPFGITNIGYSASPTFADYDRDGDLDLFVGNNSGDTLLFANTAPLDATTPTYSAPVTNPFGITDVGWRAKPDIADYDRDGDLDLFIGNSDGNTLLFTNTAPLGATTPAYSAPLTNPFGMTNVSFYASPALADYDGDGDLDLFIGDGDGNTLLFTNTAATPVAPVSSTTPDGTYGVGAIITLTVSFSEPVFVNSSGGTPTLQLETGAIDRLATYTSGSGTNTLSFQYTVQAGDTSNDLDQLSANALQRNGGTIQDAAGNYAILTLAAPGASGSLAANAQLVIDAGIPYITLEAQGNTKLLRRGDGKAFAQVGSGARSEISSPYGAAVGNASTAWQMLAAESVAGVNKILWRYNPTKQTHFWTLDASWKWQSSSPLIDPNSKAGYALESEFQIDCNNDAIIGSPYTTIEENGNATLLRRSDGNAVVQMGATFHVVSSPYGAAIGNNNSQWQMLAAESVAGVNKILWRYNPTKQTHVWTLDSSWKWRSSSTLIDPNSHAGLALESEFELDCNNDSIIGPPYSPVEARGNASLLRRSDGNAVVQTGATFHAISSPYGAAVGNASSQWQMLAAESVAGVNKILWRYNPTKQTHVWTLDASWKWQSSSSLIDPNSQAGFALESEFELDCNNDSIIGSPYSPVEERGNTSLLRRSDGNAVVQTGATFHAVSSPYGAAVGNASSQWQMLAAESVAGVNKILWRYNPTKQLHIWNLDASWTWQSSSPLIDPRSAEGLSLQTSFGVDSTLPFG